MGIILSLSSVCAFAGEQKILDIAAHEDGAGRILINSTDGPSPQVIGVQVDGKLAGQEILTHFSAADLEEMKRTGKFRPVFRYHGQDAITLSIGKGFDFVQGGGVHVGYLVSLGNRKFVDVDVRYDGADGRWWVIYSGPRSSARDAIRLSGLDVKLNVLPVIGVVGIQEVQGIDEFGRTFKIPTR